MAIVLRTRGASDISWPAEDDDERDRRRQVLCELDGLLGQLEELNLRGTPVPGRVRQTLARYGIVMTARVNAPDLIEAIFEIQERFMLHPEAAAASVGCARDLEELRRRLAS